MQWVRAGIGKRKKERERKREPPIIKKLNNPSFVPLCEFHGNA